MLKTITIVWGRMNPPTLGHESLVKVLLSVAKKFNSDHLVFITASQDKKKNPLPPSLKLEYARAAFPNVNVTIASGENRTLIKALNNLSEQYEKLILVVGADRAEEFKELLSKYNKKEFDFKEISVVSAGARDPDSDDLVSSISASKMRKAAQDNDFNMFKRGAPSSFSPSMALKMFKDLRKHMGISTINEVLESVSVFQIGEEVKYKEKTYKVVNVGTNYLQIMNEDENIRAWTKDCISLNEQTIRDKLTAVLVFANAVLGYTPKINTKTPTEKTITDYVNAVIKKAVNKKSEKERAVIQKMLQILSDVGVDYDKNLIHESWIEKDIPKLTYGNSVVKKTGAKEGDVLPIENIRSEEEKEADEKKKKSTGHKWIKPAGELEIKGGRIFEQKHETEIQYNEPNFNEEGEEEKEGKPRILKGKGNPAEYTGGSNARRLQKIRKKMIEDNFSFAKFVKDRKQ